MGPELMDNFKKQAKSEGISSSQLIKMFRSE